MSFFLMSLFYLVMHFFLFFMLMLKGSMWSLTMFLPLNLNSFMGFVLMFDYVSLGFLSFVSLITFGVMKYSEIYMGLDSMSKRFILLVSLFVFSMFILIMSPSFLLMMLGWDGLGVTSFLLVIYYQNYSSLVSGLVTIYLNRLGDFFMVMSFWLLYQEVCFSLSMFYCSAFLGFIMSFIIMASMTKSAQLPFSSWLPAAMAAPTPVSSLVHSSTLVTAGVYVMIRFFYLMEEKFMSSFLIWISLVTCLGAGLIACYENDLKKLVAMSTLSQLGLMIFVYSMGENFYSFYHMVCHALFKALLFLGCGFCIMNMYGSQDSRFMMKLGFIVYINLTMIILSVISLMGFPFMAGFFSKDSIIEVCLIQGSVLMVYFFLVACCILTGLYGLKSVMLILKTFNLSMYVMMGQLGYKIFGGMVLLGLWSTMLGKFFSIIMLKLEAILIFWLSKVMGLLIVFSGMVLGLTKFWTKLFIYPFKNFFGDVLFLNWVYGNFSSKNLEKMIYLTLGELTWFLYLGPHSLYSLLVSFGKSNFSFMSGVKVSFILFFSLFLTLS